MRRDSTALVPVSSVIVAPFGRLAAVIASAEVLWPAPTV